MSQSNVWTLQLTPEQTARANSLARDEQTPREVMEQIFDLGLYQLEYRRGPEAVAARKAYQRRQRELNAEGRELLKRAQKDPELSVKLGLGTRVEL